MVVFVNGVHVLKDGEHTGQSRFVPGGIDRWPEIKEAAESAAVEQLYRAGAD